MQTSGAWNELLQKAVSGERPPLRDAFQASAGRFGRIGGGRGFRAIGDGQALDAMPVCATLCTLTNNAAMPPQGENAMPGKSHRSLFACRCCDGTGAGAVQGRFEATSAVSRRSFVAGGMAAFGFGAAAASLPAPAIAQGTANATPQRIDVHHHISPPVWVEALKKAGLDTPPVTNWTPQRSLDDMDKAGVATAITSPTQPGVGFLPAAEAAAVARASNEFAEKLAGDYKGRFGRFAQLPMPYVDETLKEIAYALDTLKADGVAFLTSYGDRYLGDPAFAPVWDELNRRKATVFTHPTDPKCCSANLAGLAPTYIEFGTDTTRTVASLIFSRTAERCPDVNFVFCHGGGTVTALTERFTVQMLRTPKYKDFTAEGVFAQLKRFYYDTAQASNPIAMASLTKLVSTTQIVYGTDYPYRTGEEHVKALAGIFEPEDLAKIDRGNALRLLPHWRA
jgi:predicted TIM-barrel fold metal-dependent hydrolase